MKNPWLLATLYPSHTHAFIGGTLNQVTGSVGEINVHDAFESLLV